MKILITYSIVEDDPLNKLLNNVIVACPSIQYIQRFSRATYANKLPLELYNALAVNFKKSEWVGFNLRKFFRLLRIELFKMEANWPKDSFTCVFSRPILDLEKILINVFGKDKNYWSLLSIPDGWEGLGKDVIKDMDVVVQIAARLGLLEP